MNAQDLMPFCSTYRETMLLPFTHGPWTYASDGRIIVRIPALDTVPPRDHQPKDPEKAIPASSAGLTLAELPPCYDSLYPVFVKCDECDGLGYYRQCQECHGNGSIECPECQHEESCRDCKGNGVVSTSDTSATKCEECDGSGQYEKTTPVSLSRGQVFLAHYYLKKALTLPNARLFYQDAHSALRIEFDGGDGAVMPIRHPDSRQVTADQWPAMNA